MRFAIQSPQIVHELIDGEVVIVNFGNGRYYSLERVGAEVWQCLLAGMTVEAIEQHLASWYDAPPAEIPTSLSTFLQSLLVEGVVARVDEPAIPAGPPEAAAPARSGPRGSRFEAPVVTLYNDMEGLLLLDPVHTGQER